jgi:dTDP-4-dehydrorhamnose 3,5-epimerase
MKAVQAALKDALIIVPEAHEDYRGFFMESFRASDYAAAGITTEFVQENLSHSTRGVLRGLHYDPNVAKLLQVVYGRTYHVIADMRPESPTYCQWQSFILSHENHKQVYVPPGCANGFYVLSEVVYVHYKQGTYFNPATERQVRWNDPVLGVKWPVEAPLLSEKDRRVPDYQREPPA